MSCIPRQTDAQPWSLHVRTTTLRAFGGALPHADGADTVGRMTARPCPDQLLRARRETRMARLPQECSAVHDPGSLTYVVLDVPDPQASAVMSVRLRHADLFRAALPVEVTLTDSMSPEQDAGRAFAALDRVASRTPAIATSFSGAYRFPDSDVFVMRPEDDSAFQGLRQSIIAEGLAFEPTLFPFVPHCTLRTRSPVSETEADDLLRTRIRGPMLLDTLSVYTLSRTDSAAGVECRLRHRVRLSPRSPSPSGHHSD